LEELDECTIANALTDILKNSAFWKYYRQYGSPLRCASDAPGAPSYAKA
jgi:hypothetical protein